MSCSSMPRWRRRWSMTIIRACSLPMALMPCMMVRRVVDFPQARAPMTSRCGLVCGGQPTGARSLPPIPRGIQWVLVCGVGACPLAAIASSSAWTSCSDRCVGSTLSAGTGGMPWVMELTWAVSWGDVCAINMCSPAGVSPLPGAPTSAICAFLSMSESMGSASLSSIRWWMRSRMTGRTVVQRWVLITRWIPLLGPSAAIRAHRSSRCSWSWPRTCHPSTMRMVWCGSVVFVCVLSISPVTSSMILSTRCLSFLPAIPATWGRLLRSWSPPPKSMM